MSENNYYNIVKEVLITHFEVKEEEITKKAIMRDLNPDFILIANLTLLEKLLQERLNKSVRLKGNISMLNATVEDLIKLLQQ